jgi:hypothetical protein
MYGSSWSTISIECYESKIILNTLLKKFGSAPFKEFVANEYGHPDAYETIIENTKEKQAKDFAAKKVAKEAITTTIAAKKGKKKVTVKKGKVMKTVTVKKGKKTVAKKNRRQEPDFLLGNDWWEQPQKSTAVSRCSQVHEHGQLIISLAKKADFCNLEFINPMKGEEDLRNQTKNCTASKYLLPYSGIGVQKYREQVQKVFYKGIHFNHNWLHFKHAN